MQWRVVKELSSALKRMGLQKTQPILTYLGADRSRVQQEAPRRASLAVQPLHQHDSLPVTDGVIRFVLMCHGLISTPRAPLADAYCQFCVQTCAATAASRRRSFIRCSHLCVCVCVFSVCVFITAVPIIKPFGWARGIVDEPRPV
jgi:hypothetical protein